MKTTHSTLDHIKTTNGKSWNQAKQIKAKQRKANQSQARRQANPSQTKSSQAKSSQAMHADRAICQCLYAGPARRAGSRAVCKTACQAAKLGAPCALARPNDSLGAGPARGTLQAKEPQWFRYPPSLGIPTGFRYPPSLGAPKVSATSKPRNPKRVRVPSKPKSPKSSGTLQG